MLQSFGLFAALRRPPHLAAHLISVSVQCRHFSAGSILFIFCFIQDAAIALGDGFWLCIKAFDVNIHFFDLFSDSELVFRSV